MSEQLEAEKAAKAKQIAIDEGVLAPCEACSGVHRTDVDPVRAYKRANQEFSEGRHSLFGDRRSLTDAVKSAVDSAAAPCAGAGKPAIPAAAQAAPPMVSLTPTAPPPAPALSARDAALQSLPPAMREALLRKASDLGVHRSDDVVWALAASVIDATLAAQVAGQHVQMLAAETGKIPDLIYQGAVKASGDIKGTMETAIASTIQSTLDVAVQSGATVLRQAAADLPKIGRDNQDRIVSEWRAALTDAARKHTWAGYFQRLSVSIALAAVLVGALFVGGVAAGGWGIGRLLIAAHRVTPHGWRLEVGKNGKPLCGALAGHQACLARRVPTPGA